MQLLTTCFNRASRILTTLFFNSVHPLTTTYQVKHQLPQDLLTRLVTHFGFDPHLWISVYKPNPVNVLGSSPFSEG